MDIEDKVASQLHIFIITILIIILIILLYTLCDYYYQLPFWIDFRGFEISLCPLRKVVCLFIGLAYQGKDIVFRFIIEYSSLRDFGP
jgi:hypothetical protein